MKKIIALDCDGVLIDYNAHYPTVWEAAFGEKLSVKNPGYHHAHNEYDCTFEDQEQKSRFYSAFDGKQWENMPVISDAFDACNELVSMGYELVCVTSMPEEFLEFRERNLKLHNFPISKTYAVGRDRSRSVYNPKLEALLEINPVAFVDDYAANFINMEETKIHRALIYRNQPDSPSKNWLHLANSTHTNLQDFVDFWRMTHA